MVGSEGRGRGVGGDGAMAMGCWLRGRSAWEDEGVMIADNSCRNKSGHDTISSSDHAWSTTLTQKETDRDRGKCGIRGIRGIRGHHAGSGGAARGPGRWAMRGLSTGGLGAKGLFTLPSGIGGSN